MVDMVVHRHKLRATLAELCRVLTKTQAQPHMAIPALPPAAPETWAGQTSVVPAPVAPA
jgi:acetyl-CoA carboxylase carboxyl transferase subunit beta